MAEQANHIDDLLPARARVVALVPAHDEAEVIAATLSSLLAQSRPPELVVVAADNCSDATVALAKGVAAAHPGRVEVFETSGNTARKAGALNQAWRRFVVGAGFDMVVQIDADTVFDEHFVERCVAELSWERTLGGVCARMGVAPRVGRGFGSWAAWQCQRLEYYRLDAARIERRGRVWVVSGSASVLRYEALAQVAAGRAGPWDETSVVEDFVLTCDLVDAGWTTGTAMAAFCWTHVPESFGALAHQRLRWQGGTLLELGRRPRTPAIRRDRRSVVLALAALALHPLYVALAVLFVVSGAHPHPVGLAGMAVIVADRIWRMRWVPRKGVRDWLVALSVLPDELYTAFLESVFVVSLWRARRALRRAVGDTPHLALRAGW